MKANYFFWEKCGDPMLNGKLISVFAATLFVILIMSVGCISQSTTTEANTGEIHFLVSDSDGQPLQGAKVVSITQPDDQLKLTGLTGADGTDVFNNVKAGDYQFYVSRFDYNQTEISASAIMGQITNVQVRLELSNPTSTTTTTTTISTISTASTYSISELKYILLAAYPDYFWCDPDFYPVARPGSELGNAIAQFTTIIANQEEFTAILNHLSLPSKAGYTEDEKLQIYREYKKLNGAVQVVSGTPGYTFTIRTGQGQGKTYQGIIAIVGVIKVTSETTSFNTCPICLATGTLIDTPNGPIPVEELGKGTAIYTVDSSGNKITAVIVETASVQAPEGFQIIHLVLGDGRTVSASPGHPTPDGRAISDLKVGDVLDGEIVISVAPVPYSGFTYDILPEGGTGLYWANSILLKSTLAQ
jgi:Carboxypeptidase regulatory-like domain/Hint domain